MQLKLTSNSGSSKPHLLNPEAHSHFKEALAPSRELTLLWGEGEGLKGGAVLGWTGRRGELRSRCKVNERK